MSNQQKMKSQFAQMKELLKTKKEDQLSTPQCLSERERNLNEEDIMRVSQGNYDAHGYSPAFSKGEVVDSDLSIQRSRNSYRISKVTKDTPASKETETIPRKESPVEWQLVSSNQKSRNESKGRPELRLNINSKEFQENDHQKNNFSGEFREGEHQRERSSGGRSDRGASESTNNGKKSSRGLQNEDFVTDREIKTTPRERNSEQRRKNLKEMRESTLIEMKRGEEVLQRRQKQLMEWGEIIENPKRTNYERSRVHNEHNEEYFQRSKRENERSDGRPEKMSRTPPPKPASKERTMMDHDGFSRETSDKQRAIASKSQMNKKNQANDNDPVILDDPFLKEKSIRPDENNDVVSNLKKSRRTEKSPYGVGHQREADYDKRVLEDSPRNFRGQEASSMKPRKETEMVYSHRKTDRQKNKEYFPPFFSSHTGAFLFLN